MRNLQLEVSSVLFYLHSPFVPMMFRMVQGFGIFVFGTALVTRVDKLLFVDFQPRHRYRLHDG